MSIASTRLPKRLGRIWPGEVLVVDSSLPDQGAFDRGPGPRRPFRAGMLRSSSCEQRVHLERAVEVALGVEDGHADVAALVQQRREVFRDLISIGS